VRPTIDARIDDPSDQPDVDAVRERDMVAYVLSRDPIAEPVAVMDLPAGGVCVGMTARSATGSA